MTTTQNPGEERIATVPAFLLDAEEHRYKKIIRWLLVGWGVSFVALAVPTFMALGRVWG